MFTLVKRDGNARRGQLTLAHGTIQTPCFMPVGTAATVKGLTSNELIELGAQIILANTYHLWLRPGLDTIVAMGGLHAFMQWSAPILTDSGGFQVFSLEGRRRIDADGVSFQSHLDGSHQRFTPETVVHFQEDLGVDIAMALDICVRLPATADEIEYSVARTTDWAQRCVNAQRHPSTTKLFAIVQGGLDAAMRERSARELVALDCAGYAIGGLSVGETRAEMDRVTALTAGMLPEAKPRYLMGVGTVRDLISAVDRGVDMFDCVYPTRCGRNGRALLRDGHLNIRNATYQRDPGPIDPQCLCIVCRTYSRGYLSHLIRAGEMLGGRLLSYHNLALLTKLMAESREAIEEDRWTAFRDAALSPFMEQQR